MAAPELLLLHDGNPMVRGVAEQLSAAFQVRRVNMLDTHQLAPGAACGVVVCANRSALVNYPHFREKFDIGDSTAIFVMPSFSAEFAGRLRAFDIESYFVAPVDPNALVTAVNAARNRAIEGAWLDRAAVSRDALVASRHTFKKAFSDLRIGGGIDIAEVRDVCALISEAARAESLENWLSAIKDHHDYTYRHCMAVCGLITHFGVSMGVRADDLNLLSMGGLLHDVGKARIPLSILDKPGKLDDAEAIKMREHPAFSRVIMDSMEGLDPRIVRMAVHHHEKLDGNGYPDGLEGAQIDDLVRLTSIADVFSALIDERSYKPAMSYEAAFARMETMAGHLDIELLRRFKEFAMDGRDKAA